MRFADAVFGPFFAVPILVSFVCGQGQVSSPPQPLFPTSMATCNKFQADYDRYTNRLTDEHERCLMSHASAKGAASGATAAKAGKAAAPEPVETCSVRACQSLHTRMYSAKSTGAAHVSSCRQTVQHALDEQARKKQAEEAAKQRDLDDKKQAGDDEARRRYSDLQESTQAARDKLARQQAEADAAWRQRHDELMKQQKNQRDKAAADAMQEQQARDRRLDVDGFSEKHAAWKVRDDQRKAQIEQLEDAASNLDDEQQRHAALESAVKQIQQIKAQSKQDPEPK
jgi:hypothetical protein